MLKVVLTGDATEHTATCLSNGALFLRNRAAVGLRSDYTAAELARFQPEEFSRLLRQVGLQDVLQMGACPQPRCSKSRAA